MDLFIIRTWLTARAGLRNEQGANLVEYLLLLAFIAVIVLVAVKALGSNVSTKLSSANGTF